MYVNSSSSATASPEALPITHLRRYHGLGRHFCSDRGVYTKKSGQRLVKLRNPWGTLRMGIWEGPWSGGSMEWPEEILEKVGHVFGSDSFFLMSYEDLLDRYRDAVTWRVSGWLKKPSWLSSK